MALILASNSKIRAEMMRSAGLDFQIHAADIDEVRFKQDWFEKTAENTQDFPQLAIGLACEKATAVSTTFPGDYVIASDQLLVFKDRVYDKPVSLDDLKQRLQLMAGEIHYLITSLVVMISGKVVFKHHEEAAMQMHRFDTIFLQDYMESISSDVLGSVGGYQIEARGITLFDRISGDYHGILGLPLLPLMRFLRQTDIIVQ